MTDAGWAGDKVSDAQRRKPRANMIEIAESVLQAEHARSVRIVRALDKAAKLDQHKWQAAEKVGYRAACEEILFALKRGRGGKG